MEFSARIGQTHFRRQINFTDERICFHEFHGKSGKLSSRTRGNAIWPLPARGSACPTSLRLPGAGCAACIPPSLPSEGRPDFSAVFISESAASASSQTCITLTPVKKNWNTYLENIFNGGAFGRAFSGWLPALRLRNADLRSGALPVEARSLPGRRPALRGQCPMRPARDLSSRNS